MMHSAAWLYVLTMFRTIKGCEDLFFVSQKSPLTCSVSGSRSMSQKQGRVGRPGMVGIQDKPKQKEWSFSFVDFILFFLNLHFNNFYSKSENNVSVACPIFFLVMMFQVSKDNQTDWLETSVTYKFEYDCRSEIRVRNQTKSLSECPSNKQNIFLSSSVINVDLVKRLKSVTKQRCLYCSQFTFFVVFFINHIVTS